MSTDPSSTPTRTACTGNAMRMITVTAQTELDDQVLETAITFNTATIVAVIAPHAVRAEKLPYQLGCEMVCAGIASDRSFHIRETYAEVLDLLGASPNEITAVGE